MWHYILMGLGWIINIIYDIFHNYGVAIILFTIVIKGLLLPLNIKSQKAMKKQQKIQPIVAELQKKYANDQNKLQQEMAKVYKENGVSMAGGCLPMLIQMPILLALYQIIRSPLTYVLNTMPYKDFSDEIIKNVETLKQAFIDMGGVMSRTATQYAADTSRLIKYDQIDIANWASTTNTMPQWHINFNFLGLDLSRTPWEAFSYIKDISANLSIVLLLIIPILAVISSIAQSKLSMKQTGQSQNKDSVNDQAQSMNKAMIWMMPVMTGYFALILPAGLGLYWIISGVVQIVQQIILNNHFDKEKGDDFVVKLPKSNYNNQHGKKRKKH